MCVCVCACVRERQRDFHGVLFMVQDSLGLALLLSGGLLLLHHHNGSCYHIHQLDTTHTHTHTLPSISLHTIPSPALSLSLPLPLYVFPLHISAATFLHIIALWEGERVNDSSNSSPTLCDTPFVALIRAHNGSSGVCVRLLVCACV